MYIFRQMRSGLYVRHHHNSSEIHNALVSRQSKLLSWKSVNRYKFSPSYTWWGWQLWSIFICLLDFRKRWFHVQAKNCYGNLLNHKKIIAMGLKIKNGQAIFWCHDSDHVCYQTKPLNIWWSFGTLLKSLPTSSSSQRLKIHSRTRQFSPNPGHIKWPSSLVRNQFTWKISGILRLLWSIASGPICNP